MVWEKRLSNSLWTWDLEHLEGFGEKSAQKLLTSIEKSRTITLGRFVTSLSIPQVGEETAEDLADEYYTLENLMASAGSMQDLQGIGPIIAESVRVWFDEPENKKLIEKLKKHVTILPQKKQSSGVLSKKTFVITGTLPTLSRDEAKELIKKAGGSVSGSVSSKTSFVLAGENPGDKLSTAKKLSIAVISEQELLKMLQK